MPHFEHTTTVAKPLEHVAAVLTAPAAESLYAPTIIRITLDASADGRAADLIYEQVHTTASRTPERTEQGRNHSTRVGAPFTGSGVDGYLTYRLVPRSDATELVQHVEYEFAEWFTIDLVAGPTRTHNDRQFAAHLAAVQDLVEADTATCSVPPERARDSTPAAQTR